jgi:hypothetical protein
MSKPLRIRFLYFLVVENLITLLISLIPMYLMIGQRPVEMAGLLLLGVFSWVTTLKLSRLEEKTKALEVLFLVLFFWGLSGELFRVWFFVSETYQWGQSINILFLRLIYALRSFSLLSFFVSSLFLTGWGFRRTSRIIPFLLMVSLLMAWAIPISSEFTQANGLYAVGIEDLFQTAVVFFTVLSMGARWIIVFQNPQRGTRKAELLLGVIMLLWYGILYWQVWVVVAPFGIAVSFFWNWQVEFYRGN